jgi:hypothetical protein
MDDKRHAVWNHVKGIVFHELGWLHSLTNIQFGDVLSTIIHPYISADIMTKRLAASISE